MPLSKNGKCWALSLADTKVIYDDCDLKKPYLCDIPNIDHYSSNDDEVPVTTVQPLVEGSTAGGILGHHL